MGKLAEIEIREKRREVSVQQGAFHITAYTDTDKGILGIAPGLGQDRKDFIFQDELTLVTVRRWRIIANLILKACDYLENLIK